MLPHMEHLYRLAYRFTGHRDDAEDLLQDFLTKCLRYEEKMTTIDNLRGWLSLVLHNLYIDQVRRKVNIVPWPDDENADVMLEASSLHYDPEIGFTFKQINKALQQLNPDQRVLLAMHDIEGYTLSEISEMLGTPIGTLKSRLNRARKKLKMSLSEEPIISQKRLCK